MLCEVLQQEQAQNGWRWSVEYYFVRSQKSGLTTSDVLQLLQDVIANISHLTCKRSGVQIPAVCFQNCVKIYDLWSKLWLNFEENFPNKTNLF